MHTRPKSSLPYNKSLPSDSFPFLSPNRPLSSKTLLGRENLFKTYSLFTEENTCNYEQNLKTIGTISRKNDVLLNNTYYTQSIDKNLITKRSIEQEEIQILDEYELKDGINKSIELNKYGFQYFFINLKGKRSPLRLELISLKSNQSVKIYYSNKARKPNSFNSLDYHEGRTLWYYDPKRSSKFEEDKLFITVYSIIRNKLILKLEFAKLNKKVKKIKVLERLKTKPTEISSWGKEFLNEEIRKIFLRKRKKILMMSGGISKIKTNIQLIEEYKPDKKIELMQFKRCQSAKQIKNVLSKKKIIENETKEKIKQEFEKRELIHEIKERIINEQKILKKKQLRQIKWLKVFSFMKIISNLRTILFKKYVEKAKVVHNKVLQRRTIKKIKKILYQKAPTIIIRTFLESTIIMKSIANQLKKKGKIKSKKIICNFLQQTSFILNLNDKYDAYMSEIEKIMLHWKLYRRRQEIFRDNLRILWNKVYLECNSEFRSYIDAHNIKDREKMLLINSKTKELQENILSTYFYELLEDWKKKTSKFMRTEKEIKKSRSDYLIRKVLKVWYDRISRKFPIISGVVELKTNNDFKSSDLEIYDPNHFIFSLHPPILFKLPNFQQIKNLVFKYLDLKKRL